MTSEELKVELDKQIERENFQKVTGEYLAAKKMFAESGNLTETEAMELALALIRQDGAFEILKHSKACWR